MARVPLVAYILLASEFLLFSSASVSKLWATYDSPQGTLRISEQEPKDFVAVVSFENTINKTGWANLDLATFSTSSYMNYTDSQQTYAAGFLEAYVTRSLIKMHHINTLGGFCPSPLSSHCRQLREFLTNNLNYVLQQIKLHAATDYYWHHVQLFMQQIAGLQDGYVKSTGTVNLNIDVFGLYLFQVDGDMEDLDGLFPSNKSSSGIPKTNFGLGTGRCSALIRLLKDYSDLYIAQDTWSDLNSMLRILKKYSFDLHYLPDGNEKVPGNTMTFSSYPGVLMSGDDFYIMSSGLVTQETTIGNSNPDLNKYIVPESVLEGIRSMVANRIADCAQTWAKVFSLQNSGTYNNQWMIIDYNVFQPGNPFPNTGLFYLLEQIPHHIHYEDLTVLLYGQTYYASYNVAYFDDIYNESGMAAMAKKYGNWFTYHYTPRALIFRRDVDKVVDLDSMTKLMRYNNFKHDPLSHCNCTPSYSAENAIACRDDLNPINGTYELSMLGHRPHVATDMKLTSYSLSKTQSFLAISGPTDDDLPSFQWSKSDYNDKLSHVGHPDLWHFPRILFNGSHPMS